MKDEVFPLDASSFFMLTSGLVGDLSEEVEKDVGHQKGKKSEKGIKTPSYSVK
ncbi:MAG: hypothetical protein HDR44_03980 [Allobaculum sp.]|nr:hypothetical protein [Allobaculum sp.]